MVFLVGILLFLVARLTPLGFWLGSLGFDLATLLWGKRCSFDQSVIPLWLGLQLGTDKILDDRQH